MARPPQNKKAAAELGRNLTNLHRQLPPELRPWRQLTEAIAAKTGTVISVEHARKMHAGLVDPTVAQPEHLFAMIEFYDVPVADLGEATADRLANLRELAQNWKKLSREAITGQFTTPLVAADAA